MLFCMILKGYPHMLHRSRKCKQVSESRLVLQNPYAHLNGEGGFDSASNRHEQCLSSQVSADRLRLGNQYAHIDNVDPPRAELTEAALGNDDSSREPQLAMHKRGRDHLIELEATKLHKILWRRRHELWPNGVPTDPVAILNPEIALNLIGFDFDLSETLGSRSIGSRNLEVAGILDRYSKRVSVSGRLPTTTRKFTTAHELGHAILHTGVLMHRDRPLDGSQRNQGKRERIEIEADKFATVFLMPEKLVKARFEELFLCDIFFIDESTAFALDPSGSLQLLAGKKTVRELTRILASAQSFNGRHFPSLAEQFRVSVEAMAIRLEELDLIDQ